jgi:uncharacterized membrane protein YhaH (DUF805 family)
MRLLALLFRRSGQITRRPFAIAIITVYLVSFYSPALLLDPVISKVGLWPFALFQGLLGWIWTVLHVKRLRDAGRSPSVAIGFACIYVVEQLVLLAIMAWLMSSLPSREIGGSVLRPFMMLFVMTFASPQSAPFVPLAAGFLTLLFTPGLIGFGYSIWTGTRPSQQAAIARS